MSGTRFKIRDLTQEDMARLAGLLRYGDVGKIAARCKSVEYQRVSDVIRKRIPHDEVWKELISYLNELPDVDLDPRIAECLGKNKQ